MTRSVAQNTHVPTIRTKEKKMKTLYKIALLIMVVVLAVSCAPKPAASGPVTIHVLTMDQAGLKPAEIDQIARDFEAKNPDIKVVMEYLGYDFLHDKITPRSAANPPAYEYAMNAVTS